MTRFLTSRKYFAATTGRVKPPALLPRWHADHARLETSTHRSTGLTTAQAWQLGYQYVENAEFNRRISARGICLASAVRAAGLTLDVNGEPYPRHADVIQWPQEEDAQLMRATEIANSMTLDIDPRQ